MVAPANPAKPLTREFPSAKQTASATNKLLSDERISSALRHLVRDTYLPDTLQPYHGIGHTDTVWERAQKLVERVRRLGIEVDEIVLERATLLHDALSHLNPKLLGFDSPEELAAHVAFNFLISQGCKEEEARKVEQVILATHPLYEPKSTEEILMRAADLWNLQGSYSGFCTASHHLHREAEIRSDSEIPLREHVRDSFSYLNLYMWRMLELTPESRDLHGRSFFHMSALENLIAFTAEVLDDPAPRIIAEVFGEKRPEQPKRLRELPKDSFYVAFAHGEDEREQLLAKIRQEPSKAFARFVVPGTAQAAPLPDFSCDELRLYDCSLGALREAARVIKPGGELLIDAHIDEVTVHALSTLQKQGFSLKERKVENERLYIRFQRWPSSVEKLQKSSQQAKDTLRGWVAALEDVKTPQFSGDVLAELRRPMYRRYEILHSMGLLRAPVISVSAEEFLRAPEQYMQQVPGENLFPFVEPKTHSPELPRAHNVIVKRQEMIALANATVSGYNPEDFMVTLTQAQPVRYNGNITVSESGQVYAEFCAGAEIPSRQESQILFRAWRDPLMRTFRYSSEDASARNAAYTAISALPGYGEGRDRVYQPGYYEVALALNDSKFVPHFYDYRQEPFFIPEDMDA